MTTKELGNGNGLLQLPEEVFRDTYPFLRPQPGQEETLHGKIFGNEKGQAVIEAWRNDVPVYFGKVWGQSGHIGWPAHQQLMNLKHATVKIGFVSDLHGKISQIRIIQSSGNAVIDKDALDFMLSRDIQTYGVGSQTPKEATNRELSFVIPVEYDLNSGAGPGYPQMRFLAPESPSAQ